MSDDTTPFSNGGGLFGFDSASINSEFYNQALSSAYGFRTRLADPDEALAADPLAFNKMLMEPSIFHARQQRTHSVALPDWEIEPGDDSDESIRLAKIEEKAFKQIKGFTAARVELADAPIIGRTVQVIRGKWMDKRWGDGKMRKWWVPTKLQDVDKRRFRFVPSTTQRTNGDFMIDLKEEMWSVANRDWRKIKDQDRFIRITYNDREDRLGAGHGLIATLYFFWMFKGAIFSEGMQAVKRWAQGQVILKISRESLGSKDKDNATLVKEAGKELQKARSDGIIILDKDDEYEIHEPPGKGQDMARGWIDYLDNWITRTVLGSVRPTGGGAGATGARAQAEVEEEQSEILYRFDREIIDEAISTYLPPYFEKKNRMNLRELGLGLAESGIFKTVFDSVEDPDKAVDRITKMHAAGFPLVTRDVYEKAQMEMPDNMEPVFPGAADPVPAPAPFKN